MRQVRYFIIGEIVFVIAALLLITTIARPQELKTATPTTPAATSSPPIIPFLEIDDLKYTNLRLRRQLIQEQLNDVDRQISETFLGIRDRLCKAAGVKPEDYDGQITEKGIVLVRRTPPPPTERPKP